MSSIITAFDALTAFVSNSVKDKNITQSSEHIQYSTRSCTIVLGFSSLRLLVVDAEKQASITIVPSTVNAGDYTISKNISIGLHNTDLRHERTEIYVNSGQLFQFSTMYDYDFSIIKEFMPKYLELVESFQASRLNDKVMDFVLKNAISSLQQVCAEYANE